ncbi:MAG: peptidoglycan DD-metalloendopeptidase family protein [Chitinophagales bacterium]|nr:peptidoglycan DD-metalloendopeptidase family protein [Chitinophagales bacterium]
MQLLKDMINRKWTWVIASLAVIVCAGYWLVQPATTDDEDNNGLTEAGIEPLIRYGMDVSRFIVKNHIVKPNEFFADILTGYNVAYSSIDYIARESKGIFNLNKIKAGNNCTMLCEETDSGLVCRKLIYEESKTDFVVFNMDDSLFVYRGQKKVERKKREVSGVINSSLYETLEANNISPALAVRMADIFAWSVDFYRIQKGDRFKVIYEEDFVQDESVGIGQIQAVLFNSGGKDFYALYYAKEKGERGDYYDENGNSMKKMFLKAPVKFSRISSRYTMKRFHPVTKAWKAHLGTDYAAPHGTPIMATADGVIEAATFNPNNGNYVKIRHSGQYKTQYLHMSKIASGMRPGLRVKQGDVIGYVGSTGLATGPHVCYRFWKDGKQVDPLKQSLAYAEPLPAKYKLDFLDKTKGVKTSLDGISYEQHNIAVIKQKQEQKEEAVRNATEFVAKFF